MVDVADESCRECALRLLLSLSCRFLVSVRRRSKLDVGLIERFKYFGSSSYLTVLLLQLFISLCLVEAFNEPVWDGKDVNEFRMFSASVSFPFALQTHVKSSSQHVDSSNN